MTEIAKDRNISECRLSPSTYILAKTDPPCSAVSATAELLVILIKADRERLARRQAALKLQCIAIASRF